MEDFYKLTGFKTKIKEVNIKIDKKTIYENVDINKDERKILSECIEKIEIAYVLNSNNINIQPYKDENIEYESIAFINVKMRKKDKILKIAELLNSSIPNPIVLIFQFEDNINISTAHKRLNKGDKNKTIFENINCTGWINLNDLKDLQLDFFNAINFTNLPHTNFYEFYSTVDEAVFLYDNFNITNNFNISQNDEERILKKEMIEKLNELELNLKNIKISIAKETQFNKKAELNVKGSRIKEEIEMLKKKI